MEKETVRTNVTLAIGAVTPVAAFLVYCLVSSKWHRIFTSEKTSDILCLVRLANTIEEIVISVCLHTSLDRVERKLYRISA
jgi:hypothetical protein